MKSAFSAITMNRWSPAGTCMLTWVLVDTTPPKSVFPPVTSKTDAWMAPPTLDGRRNTTVASVGDTVAPPPLALVIRLDWHPASTNARPRAASARIILIMVTPLCHVIWQGRAGHGSLRDPRRFPQQEASDNPSAALPALL